MDDHHAGWLTIVAKRLPEWLSPWVDVYVLHAFLGVVLVTVLAVLASRGLQRGERGWLQRGGEWAYDALRGLSTAIIPHEGERWTPILGSFFLFILCMNLMGLIPGFFAPTARLSATGALGILAILSAQAVGFRVHGVHYFRRFLPNLAGVPVFVAPVLFVLMFVLHLLEELVKPMSLAIRLFGNVFGDDTALIQFALLGAGALGVFFDPTTALNWLPAVGGALGTMLGILMTAVMLVFAMVIGFVQALVFSILTGAYMLFAIEME